MSKMWYALICAVLLSASSMQAAVWTAENEWSPRWEQQFAEWVEYSFDEQIFIEGKYKGLSTDCADAVYIARAIFAYENKLPFVIRDFTGGGGYLTNKMSRWDSQKDSFVRFRQFLAFLTQVVGTKSLPLDTYPVKISRQWVKPGVVWSRPRILDGGFFRKILGKKVLRPGHAALVKDVADTGVVYLIESTVPMAVRKLKTTSSFHFYPQTEEMGLRYWYQPHEYKLPVSSIPGYSKEQYSFGKEKGAKKGKLSEWEATVKSRLAIRDETPEEMISRNTREFCVRTQERVEAVQSGVKRSAVLNGQCMGESDFDNYSTPSRDEKIEESLKAVLKLVEGGSKKKRLASLNQFLEACGTLEYLPGRAMTYAEWAERVLKGNFSSDPNVSGPARWGDVSEKSDCKQYY